MENDKTTRIIFNIYPKADKVLQMLQEGYPPKTDILVLLRYMLLYSLDNICCLD